MRKYIYKRVRKFEMPLDYRDYDKFRSILELDQNESFGEECQLKEFGALLSVADYRVCGVDVDEEGRKWYIVTIV